MIYLASPYSQPDPVICEERFHSACTADGRLMQGGLAVFCPIAHGHLVVV